MGLQEIPRPDQVTDMDAEAVLSHGHELAAAAAAAPESWVGYSALAEMHPDLYCTEVGLDNERQDVVSTPISNDTAEGSLDVPVVTGNFDTFERRVFNGELTTRSATLDDVDGLAELEARAFRRVYGRYVNEEKMQELRETFKERVELLGGWIKVSADEENQLCGMMITCPFSIDPGVLPELDMTENETLKEVYDPNGKSGYIVNLAVDPNASGFAARDSVRYALYYFTLTEGLKAGIENAYLESRLPRFKKWLQHAKVDPTQLTDDELYDWADSYWQSYDTDKEGNQLPIDILLREYVRDGVKPLKLVRGAWSEDDPSLGFGVFCVKPIFEAGNPAIYTAKDWRRTNGEDRE